MFEEPLMKQGKAAPHDLQKREFHLQAVWRMLISVCTIDMIVVTNTRFIPDLSYKSYHKVHMLVGWHPGCKDFRHIGNCILAIGAFATEDCPSSIVKVKVQKSSQIFVVRTAGGIVDLLNLGFAAEARLNAQSLRFPV